MRSFAPSGTTVSVVEVDETGILLCAVLTFFQQAGFAFLEVGHVRAKNARNILLKNLMDTMIAGVGYWAVGFAFAYGNSAGGVIGTSNFFLSDGFGANTALLWFFSWVLCLTATTIVSGAICERAQFEAYLAYAPLMSCICYPVVVHWVWQGWLNTFAANCVFLDFAGGATVHLVGGTAAFVGAWVIGPRLGRFDEDGLKSMAGHDVRGVVLGTFMLWFGWYGFNIGPSFVRGTDRLAVAARAAVNTSLAGCTSGLAVLLLVWLYTSRYDLKATCNGVLGGLVAITTLCAHVESWCAFVIGLGAAVTYLGGSAALVKLRIDDPLDASVVHGLCALVGVVPGMGLFAKPEFVVEHRGSAERVCGGVFFAGNARLGFEQLGVQLLGGLVIIAFVFACSYALFWTLNRLGRLRVDQATEIAGLDNIDHGGPAYPDFVMVAHHD